MGCSRALLLCSVCVLNSGKVKGCNSSKKDKQFQIRNCTQEQRNALGRREGPVRTAFPQLTNQDGEKCSLSHTVCVGNISSRDSHRPGLWATATHLPVLAHSSCNINPAYKSLLRNTHKTHLWRHNPLNDLESRWPALASSLRGQHAIFLPWLSQGGASPNVLSYGSMILS